jgi:deoxyribodipyrimidine photo-lyase
MNTAIWWVRRDLRLNDNQALHAALAHEGGIVPVFIIDRKLINSSYVGDKRLAFLYAGLQRLDEDLRAKGNRLVVRSGSPANELSRLLDESGAIAIYAEADHSPYARRRDQLVKKHLPLNLVGSTAAYPPGSVLKPDGSPYTVYTPFNRSWKSLPPLGSGSILSSPERISSPLEIPSQPIPAIPQLSNNARFIPGEDEAQKRLQAFLNGEEQPKIYNYDSGRNMLDINGTSQLSPYLRFGMLSPRQAVITAQQSIDTAPDEQSKKGAETWLNELIWRDFYIHILHHYPYVREMNFRIAGIRWENDPILFETWSEGRTGYPIIDAGMLQLITSGWMHNRARMITSSFLTKDLLIDWRWGERWFMQHLIDGDPASNNGGWQWTAGTGTDAAPYFRIFNPISQSMKFDPHGIYVRRWVAELATVPDEFIHQPWLMPPEEQKKSSCRIGIDYPQPVINHSWARERALEVYSLARSLDGDNAP